MAGPICLDDFGSVVLDVRALLVPAKLNQPKFKRIKCSKNNVRRLFRLEPGNLMCTQSIKTCDYGISKSLISINFSGSKPR